MAALADRVKVATATTGTGTVTLGAAVTGFRTFAAAGIGDGAVVSYVIEDANGAWEVGRGTYASSGPTLARTTVIASSDAGSPSNAAINLSGSAVVFISALAIDIAEKAATADGFTKGRHSFFIPACALNPEITNGASRSYTSLATNLQIQDSLDFDTSTQEFANALTPMPKRWDRGLLSFKSVWTAASGSGTAEFAVQCAAVSDDDPANPSWGVEQVSNDTLLAAGDYHVGPESQYITVAGSPAAEDGVWFRVKRNPASDTLGVDAQLLGIIVYYTTNAENDA